MKLTGVELHPANSSDVAVLSFRDPRRENPYNVKGIDGLDADEIVSRYYGGSGASKFYTLSLEKRTLVVKISLNPRLYINETYSSLRDDLYKIIASSRNGTLLIKFLNGITVVATVSGFVTKIESPHFQKDQEVQITVACDEPMLKAPIRTPITVAGLSTVRTEIPDILSTAPHGFIFDLKFLASTASLTITDPDDASWSFAVVPATTFLTNDVLHFSSEYNNKFLYYTRASVDHYLADRIVPGSMWPILFPGDNSFALSSPSNVSWNAISHYPTYWGV